MMTQVAPSEMNPARNQKTLRTTFALICSLGVVWRSPSARGTSPMSQLIVPMTDGEETVEDRAEIPETIADHFDSVYAKLYADAEKNLEENVREASSREEILGTIGQHGGYVKAPWCGDEACEEPIKDAIAAEIAMVPLED